MSEKGIEEKESPVATGSSPDHVFPRPGIFPQKTWQGFGEEFRRLRTKVVRAFGGEKGKVILVTSALPGEGKTTVASNLSISLAQAKWRTLLVDSDLRKPSIHSLLNVPRGTGLSDLMSGGGGLGNTGGLAERRHCDVLTAGSEVKDPAEIIQQFFPASLEAIRGRYDYVVLDSPPILSVADALLLGQSVDGVLFVVKNRSTPREAVKEALDQCGELNVLGVVYNESKQRQSYYTGYY